jgi:hypothetical protein
VSIRTSFGSSSSPARLKEEPMTPNRIVAILTPLVFAPLAGAVAAWVAENFPGVEVSASSLEEIFIAGALIALAPAAQWLHGWQKYEAREAAAAERADAIDSAQGFEDDIAFDEDIEPDEFEEEFEDPLLEDEEPVPAGG